MLAITLVLPIAVEATGLGDWKSHLAKKVVGEVAEEAIEEAMEDALQDAAFEAAVGAVDFYRVSHKGAEAESRASFGPRAGDAVESAMVAADVASGIGAALDAADVARKIHKVGKTIKKIKR
jgi:hypothetical protein